MKATYETLMTSVTDIQLINKLSYKLNSHVSVLLVKKDSTNIAKLASCSPQEEKCDNMSLNT